MTERRPYVESCEPAEALVGTMRTLHLRGAHFELLEGVAFAEPGVYVRAARRFGTDVLAVAVSVSEASRVGPSDILLTSRGGRVERFPSLFHVIGGTTSATGIIGIGSDLI